MSATRAAVLLFLTLILCPLGLRPAQARGQNALGAPPAAPDGGYRIWFDHDGWHVRGVAEKSQHRFHGTLTIQGGAKTVKPVPEKLSVKLDRRPAALLFDFTTATEAGFDFSADEAPCIVLELLVDDRHAPKRVRIGATGNVPYLFPYEACR